MLLKLNFLSFIVAYNIYLSVTLPSRFLGPFTVAAGTCIIVHLVAFGFGELIVRLNHILNNNAVRQDNIKADNGQAEVLGSRKKKKVSSELSIPTWLPNNPPLRFSRSPRLCQFCESVSRVRLSSDCAQKNLVHSFCPRLLRNAEYVPACSPEWLHKDGVHLRG